jgi:hypothetical protein
MQEKTEASCRPRIILTPRGYQSTSRAATLLCLNHFAARRLQKRFNFPEMSVAGSEKYRCQPIAMNTTVSYPPTPSRQKLAATLLNETEQNMRRFRGLFNRQNSVDRQLVTTAGIQPRRRLGAEWQSGVATLSGYAQRKLRLSFAPAFDGSQQNGFHPISVLNTGTVIQLFN